MARYKLKIIVLVFNNNGIYGGKFEGEPGTAFPEVGKEGRREGGREGRERCKHFDTHVFLPQCSILNTPLQLASDVLIHPFLPSFSSSRRTPPPPPLPLTCVTTC
jgi:hypothetical protein